MSDPKHSLLVLLAVALGLALACGLDDQSTYRASGTVVSVEPDRKQVKIK